MSFAKISADAFKSMQFNAGMILNAFDVDSPPTTITDSTIVCATTGGISAECTAEYLDMGEDVDNCPKNTKELKRHDGWVCKFSFTALNVTPELIRLSLGAADVTAGAAGAASTVTPRADLKAADFGTVYWLGDRIDGGWVLIKLSDALGTGGFSLQTEDNGKGQVSVELTGHVSINALDVVPMEFYVMEAAA